MTREDLRLDLVHSFSEAFSHLAAGLVGSIVSECFASGTFKAGMVESAEFSIGSRDSAGVIGSRTGVWKISSSVSSRESRSNPA